ncbi:iron ABC transporter substrate-binding protein [Rhizobium sp. ACO-34A]|nr:iron ABC transporter substrate-binding protein [Rhizobium sp. ACO-34A]ATN36485.1 iron ABC transporter substrate-binding protein [Rhizobium sp. ACO-34A]
MRIAKTLFYCLFLLLPAVVQARSITDAAGRQVEIPDNVTRVMVAGPPAAVLVYVLAPEKLAGWVREPGDAEKVYLLPATRDLPVYGQLTGKGGTANIEAVIAAKPDLIIDVGTVNPTYASLADKVQEQTGIPYVLIDGRFDRSAETLKEVGDILGVPARAGELAAYADEKLTDLKSKLSGIEDAKRPKVYYGRGPEGLETGLQGSINVELIEAVGGRNVAAEAGKGGLTQVSPEQILSWKPDVILAASGKFASSLKTSDTLSKLDAVTAGRVHVTPNLPFGWTDSPPGVNRLIGLVWLENLLHPEVFKVDLPAETRRFYQLFYQVDLSDEQLAKLVGQGH